LCLQELLVLALQVVVEDHAAANLEPGVLVAEPRFLLPVRRVEVRVVVEFAFAAHSGVEVLRRFVPVHRMRIKQVTAFARERQAALVVAEIDRLDEALVA
jgi:hypothetical protein